MQGFVLDILGLPTHPLVVHVVVILVPLAAIGLVATGWRAKWRESLSLPIALVAVAGAIAAFIAAMTGDSLEGAVRRRAIASGAPRPNFGDHPGDGDLARILAIVFALVAVAFWLLDNYRVRLNLSPRTLLAAYAVASIAAVAAFTAVIIAGHSGATLVWKDVGNFVSGDAGR